MEMIPMIIVSIIAGFLSTMDFWAVDLSHATTHVNDVFLVSLVIGWTIVLESIIHHYNFENHTMWLLAGIIIVAITIYLIRTQTLVNDMQYLKGMIPHHSMAILMSEKISKKTKNPEIKQLAQNIINTQYKEIELMQQILRTL